MCKKHKGTSDRICSSHLPVPVSAAGETPIQSPRCDRGWDPGIADSKQRKDRKEEISLLFSPHSHFHHVGPRLTRSTRLDPGSRSWSGR